jgi:hypothetical protein
MPGLLIEPRIFMKRMHKWLLLNSAGLLFTVFVAALVEPNQVLLGLLCGRVL